MAAYGAQAGGAIGNAISPGVGGPVGALFGSFLDGGGVTGGGGGGGAPLNSSAAVYGSGLDGSGWAVNFKGVQTASSSPGAGPGAGAGVLGTGIPMWAIVAIVGFVLWKKSASSQ